jgi:hypothetical protein
MVIFAVPVNATGDSTDPATSGFSSPMVVSVCGSPKAVVSVNTSTSAPATVYSVPTESWSSASVRAKSIFVPVTRLGKNTGVWFRLVAFITNVLFPGFCEIDMLITPSYIG